jgi:hypothetical protein
MFQSFGYTFRCWVAMELPCEICATKMPPKSINLLKSMACVSPSCLILLYRGLTGSVLKYGSVCFLFVLWIWQGHTCWVWQEFNTRHWGLHWVWWDLDQIIAWVILVASHWRKDLHTFFYNFSRKKIIRKNSKRKK